MHSKSDIIEIVINDEENKVIEELLQPPLSRYQIGLEISMRSSDFIFDCVHLLYYKCHNINYKRDESYKDFPDWIKNQKSNIKSYE